MFFKCLPQIIIEDNLCIGDTLLFGKKFMRVKKTKHAKAATFQHNYTKCILPEKDFNYKVFTRKAKKFRMFTFSGSFIFSNERRRKISILIFQPGPFSGRKLWSSCLNFMSVIPFQFTPPFPLAALPISIQYPSQLQLSLFPPHHCLFPHSTVSRELVFY